MDSTASSYAPSVFGLTSEGSSRVMVSGNSLLGTVREIQHHVLNEYVCVGMRVALLGY